MNIYEVLRRPLTTEKTSGLAEKGKYCFAVAMSANKIQVKQAVEAAWPKVHVVDVNIIHVRGKMRRRGRRVSRLPDWKKAIITLKPGDTIELFEGV